MAKDPEPSSDVSDPPLGKRVVHGSFWILSLRVSNKLLGLIRIAVLSRILLPEHFGVVGIAALAVSLIETFTQSGLGTALVRKRGEIRPYLDTLFTVSLIRSAFIFGLLVILAPAVASFFDVADATSLIRIFGISVLIAGSRNPAVIYFQRRLEFSKQYAYEFSNTLVNLVVSTLAAIALKNAWALVLGAMAGAATRWVMSYWLEPFRPRVRIEKAKFLELFHFGKWIYGTGVIFFLVHQGDDVFLGKLYGAAALGLYQMAFTISQLVTTEVSQVISHVTLPAFAKMQTEYQRLTDAFLRVLRLVSAVVFPLTGLIFVVAEELTDVVLSDKWLPIVPMVRVLAWAGLLRALKTTTEPLFNAVGRPEIHTKYQLVQLGALIVLIYPASLQLGTLGICFAVLISQMASTAAAGMAVMRHLPGARREISRAVGFPAVNTLVSISIASLLRASFDGHTVLEALLLSLIVLAGYTVLTYFCDRFLGYPIRSLVGEALSSLVGAVR